jgi:CRISPR/Cas system CSM-associated protein Csm3 (group 7 of RAMP superfamily)
MKYTIQFHSYWHCGSGLAAGADVDALVVKDENELPFIPGKTIKGLVREAMEDLMSLKNVTNVDEKSDFIKAFGYFDKDKDQKERGNMFFTNAELSATEKNAIIAKNAARFMYNSVASTAIDDNGIADKHSLRKIQVVVPCVLEGEIINIPKALEQDIENALKYIKRLGQNRNRGLGRCSITVKKEGGEQ